MRDVEVATMTRSKQHSLFELLRSFGSVCIGYSGGVDSVYLVRAAVEALGADRVLAVTGISAAVPTAQRDVARACAEQIGARHIEIATDELSDPDYAANPPNRCYYCKLVLWRRLREIADAQGLLVLADGANADDASDYRPGGRAGRERGVRSPLLDVGLTKAEVRTLSRECRLPTWDQPAAPCLSSRIPYGLAVTPERLRQIEAAEAVLRAVGFRELRVRHHGDAARVEVAAAERARALALAAGIDSALRGVGFAAVLLDVEGYRRGALNEGLVALGGTRSRAPASQPALAAGRHARRAGAEPDDPAARAKPASTGVTSSRTEHGRIGRVAALLEAGGIGVEGVRVAGHAREIVVVVARRSTAPRVASLAPAIRELGFRYVAMDLAVMNDGTTNGAAMGTDRIEKETDGAARQPEHVAAAVDGHG